MCHHLFGLANSIAAGGGGCHGVCVSEFDLDHNNRSHHATLFLRDEGGYTNVKNLLGGIHAWHDKIDPEIKKY